MKKVNKNNNLPKITLILKKVKQKSYIYPSIRKMQFFLRNKAESCLKNGYLVTIQVKYGYGINAFKKKVMFQNSGTYEKVEDLNWAFQAFVKEYIK